MTKRTIFAAALFTALLVVASSHPANAQGFHFGGDGSHVDAGYPHGRYHYNRQTTYWRSGWGRSGGHSDWHNTSHLDYHSGGFEPHYGHLDYVPSHVETHSGGHWDPHF